MKKTISFALVLLAGFFVLPSLASAVWWNPFTWRSAPKAPPAVESTSTIDTSLLPTTDDLYKRIAELEMKLDDARAKLKAAGIKDGAEIKIATTTVAAVATGLSERDLAAKVAQAIVLVQTATSSTAAPIIDTQGHILVPAHAIWVQDSSGNVTGAVPSATVSFSSGAQGQANLVGIDEASDLAVFQLSNRQSTYFLPLTYGSGTSIGDRAYVAGFPSSFLRGTIVQKMSGLIQATTDDKPLDSGSVMVSGKGALIGIDNPPACKVLEEMRTCLKYTLTANLFPSQVPKLLLGMKLYKNKQNKTPEDILMRGYLDGFYNNVNQADAVAVAVQNVTGSNSFDYFNDKLDGDTENRIAKIYIVKLKSAAINMAQAYDFLKSVTYALRVSLINDDKAINNLDPYEQMIMRQIQANNDARLNSYQTQVDFWTKKKNEYDGYVTNPSGATHNYLMAEGAFVETAADKLSQERQNILDSLPSDILNLF